MPKHWVLGDEEGAESAQRNEGGTRALERRLGRGLGSLLGQGAGEPAEKSAAAQLVLPLERIRPNPYQPRLTFDAEGLEELQESIRLHGFLQPVVVRKQGEFFELIAGERRLRAARALGLGSIPALIREDFPDAQMLEVALVENVQRRDLNALEKARGYARMMQDLALTQDQVASKVGLKRASVANHLRLLELPSKVQGALVEGLISMGHARALLAVDEAKALALVERISREGLSVRQVEVEVRPGAAAPPAAPAAAPVLGDRGELQPQAPWVAEIQRRLRDSLSARISIQNRPGYTGQIVIEYHGQDDLNRLIEQLAPSRQVR
jgi:ParB family transcriptional regulator, chromosome partitioning protein